MTDEFKMFIPIDIIKGKTIIDKTGKKRGMLFKGCASTMRKDLDGEILDPNGFDYSLFMSKGHINWNHQSGKDPMAIIGEPTAASVKNNEFHIEGFLYEDSPLAQKVYKLQEILEKNSSDRRLGFSIEGGATERDKVNKKYVKKAMILNVAIAPTPKNFDTAMSLMKSFDYSNTEGEQFVMDVIDGGERVVMNKSFDIEVFPSDMTLIKSDAFEDNVLTVYKSIIDGKIVDADLERIKKYLSGFQSVFNGMYRVSTSRY